MRVETEFGTIETDESDAQLATAIADTARSVHGIAEAAGFVGQDGQCQNCGVDARLRPLGVQRDDGSYGAMHVCADCQGGMVEQRLQQAAEREQAGGVEPDDA